MFILYSKITKYNAIYGCHVIRSHSKEKLILMIYLCCFFVYNLILIY